MTEKTQLPRRSLPAVLVFLALGLAALFVVPFYVPTPPALSDSYVFGYNNKAALLIFIAFAASFAWWSGGLGLMSRQPGEAPENVPISRRLLVVTLACTAAITVFMWLAYRRVGAINEGAYMMDRLLQLAAGHKPYRDFEFIYGPFLVYFPWLLQRLLRIPLLDAYFLAWMLEWLTGVYLLWLTVAWVSATSARKNGVFLLVFLNGIVMTISLGANYTMLRFAIAPFFAALAWRTVSSRRSPFLTSAVALLGAGWLLSYSPEQGLAFIAGTIAFFVIFLKRQRLMGWWPILLTALGSAAMLFVALHAGVFEGARAMAGGALNLPIMPSIGILMALGLLLVAACVLVNALRLRRPAGPLEFLIVIAIFALPAAFGRADAGHMMFTTLGLFIAAWTVLSYRPQGGKWMVWGYLLSAAGLPIGLYQSNNIVMFPIKAALFSPVDPHPYVRQVSTRMLNRVLGPERGQAKLAKWRDKFPVAVPNWNVPTDKPLLAPLGYPSSINLGANMPPMTNGRYLGMGDVMQDYQSQQKIDELRSHPDWLLLFTADVSCEASGPPSADEVAARNAETRRQLRLNLQTFYTPAVKHALPPAMSYCDYIRAHYAPAPYIAPIAGAHIWQRIPGS